MTIRQDVDALSGFVRRGDWMESQHYGIARLDLHFGRNYCLYRWDFPGDVGRELVGVKQSLDEAVKLIGDSNV